MELAPIVLFVYNRLEHTKRTLESLKKNKLAKDSEIFIYSDSAKNENAIEGVNLVREYIYKIDGFKKINIIKREKNLGLAKSVIDGVTNIVNKYGKVIVLEDDLLTSPHFLTFMNDSLNIYEKDTQVASIHGYIYPIEDLPRTFFIRGADCWGWATWKDRWAVFEENGQKLFDELMLKNVARELDFNNSYGYTQMLKDQISGKNSSWAIRWYVSTFLNNMLTLYPGQSYVQNIGHGKDGTHCTIETDIYNGKLNDGFHSEKIDIEENQLCRKKMEEFFKKIKPSMFQRVISKVKRLLK